MVNSEKVEILIEDFRNKYPQLYFRKNDVLVQAGDNPGDIYFITSGKVSQVDIAPNGSEIIVNTFAEPAFLSVFWLFDETNNRFTYQALSEVSVRKVPRKDVQDFMHANADVMYSTMNRLVRGLEGFMTRMSYQMYGSAQKKIAIELLIEAKRFNKNQKIDVAIESNINALTARTGLARETVSRQIGALTGDGLITKSGNKIIICDVDALENFIAAE